MQISRISCFFMKRKNKLLKNVSGSLLNHLRFYQFYPPVPARTKYGGRFTVTMIAGDGHGSQMMEYVKGIFNATRVPVDFEEVLLNSSHCASEHINEAITSIKRNGIGIKGNIHTKSDDLEYQSRNVMLRSKLDLFANILHCKSVLGIKTKDHDVDIVLIRQNTEGEYSCLEHRSIPGLVESLKVVTKKRSEEIAHFAFQYSIQKKRRKITSVHKMSVMPLTDGLFLNTCINIAKEYPEINFEYMFMDSCCTKLVSCPQQFDVLLVSNLYGNVLNNIACGLIGGAGIVPGLNFGREYVLFEIGSRSSVISSSNPLAILNASIDLLRYLGLDFHADVIQNSVNKTLNFDKILPEELGGCADASTVVKSVVSNIKEIYN